MKTSIRKATLLFLGLLALQGKTQTVSICAGSSTVLTAINSSGLTSPTYSMNPGALSSANPTFAVAPTTSTTYTLYVTGLNSSLVLVTTSNTVNVQALSVSYSVVSPQNFTLGCSNLSVCPVSIINAFTSPLPGGAISFTFLAPGSSPALPGGALSSISVITTNSPGTWSVVARDNASQCDSWSTFTIISNTLTPNIGATVPQQILDCNTPSVQLIGNSSTPNVSYEWASPGSGSVYSDTVVVNTVTLAPTSTVIANYTLIITDNGSACKSMSVVPMLQNLFKPNAAVMSPTNGICSSTLILTNVSSSGIPNGTFPIAAPVVALLWEGPSPQTTLALSSTYLAQTTGIYTMTAKDMNNGCTKTATHAVVVGPSAAFVHTITGGQAVFNDASIGTYTNLNYYWDFGDGNTSTLQNPIHNYLNGGAYLVKFRIAVSGTFCSDSVIQSVTISGVPCTANSNFSLVPTGTTQVWNAIPFYPWNVSAASWSWGDGSFSNALYTSHQYAAAGMYNICLSVTLSCVASSSTCTSYSVFKGGSQEAMMLKVNVTAPELIAGVATTESDTQVSWNILPNPNSGEFKLDRTTIKSESLRVVISDLSGRIVHDQLLESNSNLSIQTNDLPAGMYFVTLETNNLKTTKRMVVYR